MINFYTYRMYFVQNIQTAKHQYQFLQRSYQKTTRKSKYLIVINIIVYEGFSVQLQCVDHGGL